MVLVRNSLFAVHCLLLVIVFTGGCGNAGGRSKSAVSQQVENLSQEKSELENRLEQSRKENEELQRQMAVLAALPGDKRAEAIYILKEVRIGRYTNLFDEDKNGTREALIVYVKPIDDTGDVIKAAGAINVQLWDLSRPSNEALLAEWKVGSEELKKLWFDSIAMTGYRLKFDVSGIAAKFDNPLTVKVVFTDYLSGKVFTEQKTIKP